MHRHAVEYSTYPRGPRSGPGCSVPVRHHLIGPIRPTRGHIAISPHSGLYAMPSLCGSAYATREWFRTFTAHSFLACRPLRPRGVQHRYVPELRCRHGLRRLTTGSALPKFPQSVPRGLRISWLHWFASATACQAARPPVRIRLDRPAFGDFYFQAFNGSVSLSVAGYNYNSGWISFCWRDLHPLEWQLASLPGQNAKYSLRADVFCFASNNGHRSTPPPCRKSANDRDRGEPRSSAPPTPPCERVRTRRFEKLR